MSKTYEDGRSEERARIVEWLRSSGWTSHTAEEARTFAIEIEAGVHVTSSPPINEPPWIMCKECLESGPSLDRVGHRVTCEKAQRWYVELPKRDVPGIRRGHGSTAPKKDEPLLAGQGPGKPASSDSSSHEKPVCDRCGEEDSDERLLGKVDTCQTCVAADQYRIEQLTFILSRWMAAFASPGQANVVGRAKRESDLWAACKNAGLKPSEPFTSASEKGGKAHG